MAIKGEFPTLVVYVAIIEGKWGVYNTVINTWVPANELTANDVFNGIKPKIEKERGTNQIAILNLIPLQS